MVKSPLDDIDIPTDVDLGKMCPDLFESYGTKVAVVDVMTGQHYRYNDLLGQIRAVTSGLAKVGLRKGDIMAIYSPNSPEWIVMFFAVLCNGASVTGVNPTYTAYEVGHHIRDSGAKFLFTTNAHSDVVDEVVKECPSLKEVIFREVRDGYVDFDQLKSDDGDSFPSVNFNPMEDVAVIPYSSGTTGLPKGVMLTHYNVIAACLQSNHEEFLDPDQLNPKTQDVVLNFLPFFHIYGLMGVMFLSLMRGDRLVIMPRFEPVLFLETIQKYKVTVVNLVPPVVLFLATHPMVTKYDLSTVKIAKCAAAPLPQDIWIQFKKRLNVPDIRQAYGLSETTLACTRPPANSDRLRPDSSGIPVPNVEIQVVDPETGKVLGAHERGELWIRGPNVMKGYLNNPEATHSTKDDQGWLHTGDIGYYDDDCYFYIVDRMKELIKYKAFQVAPAELEALLLTHPKIADAAVIGVPDKEAGELPKAYIVLKDRSEMTADEVKNFVAGKLAKFKHLRGGVEFVSSVPKSPSGKILRRKLRDQLKKSNL